jgi:hypothetical protein
MTGEKATITEWARLLGGILRDALPLLVFVAGLAVAGYLGAFGQWGARDVTGRVQAQVSRQLCGPYAFPLTATFTNSTNSTITYIEYDIFVRDEGHSTLYETHGNYSTDRIIKPGERYRECLAEPTLIRMADVISPQYTIVVGGIQYDE